MKGNNDMKNAFDEAYEAYADVVFRFVLMKVSDRDVAKDITQDTFVKTWNFVAAGSQIERWRAFLLKTARNAVIDHYRKRKTYSLDALAEAGFEPAEEQRHTEAFAEREEVIAAISKLDETHRDVVWMRFVEDMSPKDIAGALDLKENAVSVRIHRGKIQLQQVLNIYEQ